MAVRAWVDPGLIFRVLAALGCLILLFALRWDSTLDHFDFQVWRAAETIIEEGGDPYDKDTLNLELHENPDEYGDRWIVEDWETSKRMHLFNPPSWQLELRLLGWSALAMSLVGAALTYGSMLVLSRRGSTSAFLGYLGAATYIFGFGHSASTFRFGQTGFLVAGLVGLGLVLSERRSEGLAAAGLSFKPHIALAAVLPAALHADSKRRMALVAPGVALLTVTVVLYPPNLWRSWFGALLDPDKPAGSDDMSLRTLSTRFEIPTSLSFVTLALAILLTVLMAYRWTRSDPHLLRLAGLAVTIYGSGHAFGHDWLWIVFVPVVGRWSAPRSMLVGIGVVVIYTIGGELADGGPVLVNLKSLLALVVTAYLVHQTWQSHRRTEPLGLEAPEPAGSLAS